MEVKKSPKANLENKRTLFMEIGFIFTLFVVFCAFQYSTSDTKVAALDAGIQEVIEEEDIPVTTETPPPPPEQPQIPVASDIIDIVDDDIQIDDKIISIDDRLDQAIEIMDYYDTNITDENIEEEAVLFAFVEEKPLFMGGDANNFSKWVNANLEYPEIARENGVQGRVTIEFTVMTDGSVANIKVLRGVDNSLDKEAVRIVSQSPKWTPGRQRDKAVKVIYRFPVVFQLR